MSWQSPNEEWKAFVLKENKSRGKEYFEIRACFRRKNEVASENIHHSECFYIYTCDEAGSFHHMLCLTETQ